jgi:hypothetical protein
LPGNFSDKLGRSDGFAENSAMPPIHTTKSDSDVILPLVRPAENKPFYLVVTTFSKALGFDERKYDEVSASTGSTQSIYPACKIYDSLNIEIYEYKP